MRDSRLEAGTANRGAACAAEVQNKKPLVQDSSKTENNNMVLETQDSKQAQPAEVQHAEVQQQQQQQQQQQHPLVLFLLY